MLILAADTSTTYYSVALCEDGHVLAEIAIDAGRRHSERLLETVQWLLAQTETNASQIDALAIAIGPGSFTGLRIGVSAWKGLAIGWERPLHGVNTLDVLARQNHPCEGTSCVLLDAKMSEVFTATYDHTEVAPQSKSSPRACSIEDAMSDLPPHTTFIGDGATQYRATIETKFPHAKFPHVKFVDGMNNYPRASAVAAEAQALFARGSEGDPAQVEPFYLRKSQAEEARQVADAKEAQVADAKEAQVADAKALQP